MKYELGVLDAMAKAHGDEIVERMTLALGDADKRGMAAHSIVVCVYYDGLLQFAGGDAVMIDEKAELSRASIKTVAANILRRMGAMGWANKGAGDAAGTM